MKIRIIGSCGSGKSTLAKELSMMYDLPYYEIDNMIWDRNSDNIKFSVEVRDAALLSILDSESWIVEGVQFKEWTLGTIEKADVVFLLSPNVFVRDYRIIKRFILSRTGIRPWNYKQSFRNLMKMIIEWNHRYDNEEVLRIVNEHRKGLLVVKNKRDVVNQLENSL